MKLVSMVYVYVWNMIWWYVVWGHYIGCTNEYDGITYQLWYDGMIVVS